MQFEETLVEDRNVYCDECQFHGEIELALVVYAMTEVGEWECPDCSAYHEYQDDFVWDLADAERARQKEGW